MKFLVQALELGRVPTNAEVKEEVKRLKTQRKKDREDARLAWVRQRQ
jgi:hypothetical protein